MRAFVLLAATIVAVVAAREDSTPPCRFAPLFTADSLRTEQAAAAAFLDAVYYWEGNFHQNGVGLNAAAGLTYDGHPLNYTTGLITGTPHQFSAASKESIHVGMLALALSGDERALTFVLNNDTSVSRSRARAWALTLLTRKISSYENFNAAYPGFGCYLPWFAVNDSGLVPTWDWQHTVPSLDNGEMIWALYAVTNVLKSIGEDALAARYQAWTDCMTANGRLVFYNSTVPGFRTVTTIADTRAAPSAANYGGDSGLLNDPYEGELFTVWMDLFGVAAGVFTKAEMDAIWVTKRALLSVATLETGSGAITTERGWWFSSHEKWKYLMIPYQSVPINNRVFMNGERARSWANSVISPTPGLFASVTGPVPPNGGMNLPYYSAVGVQSLAYEEVTVTDVVTPYGSMALFLADPTTALVWYAATLNATRMQNVYGSTESLNTTTYMNAAGAQTNDVCPLTTWDSKITTLLAMSGGLAPINEVAMKRDGVFDAFYQRIDAEWTRVFAGQIVGEDLGFKLPAFGLTDIPAQDFTTCV